jgi:hypothetical protein
LLGTTFSSTNPTLPNYQQGQDFLSDSVKEQLIDIVNGGQGQSEINNAIDIANPLSVLNPTLLQVFEDAVSRGEPEPCVTSFVEGENDLICKALQEQDLAKLLETTVQYPVEICHSVDDKLVSPDNRPNFALNPKYLASTEITGGVSHAAAGPQCILNAITYYVNTNNVLYRPNVFSKHLTTCPPTRPPTGIPTISPVSIPTMSPVSVPTTVAPTAPPTTVAPTGAPAVGSTTAPPSTLAPKDAPTFTQTEAPTAAPAAEVGTFTDGLLVGSPSPSSPGSHVACSQSGFFTLFIIFLLF